MPFSNCPIYFRQESFFLSETCKYLYLLFDADNPVNRDAERFVFTTEGHLFPVDGEYRRKVWEEEDIFPDVLDGANRTARLPQSSCENRGVDSPYQLPLKPR